MLEKAGVAALLFLVFATPGPAAGDKAGWEPEASVEQEALQLTWEGLASGLHAAVGSMDCRYERDAAPRVAESDRTWSASAWRGERVAGHLVAWSAGALQQLRVDTTPLVGPGETRIPIQARFVRYVLADDRLLEDIIDPRERLDIPARTCRPVWVSVDVPGEALPGLYQGEVIFRAEGEKPIPIQVRIEVLPALLPPPSEWQFHLDLWQHPYAVARYHGLEPWSKEHLLIMKKVLKMAADAGMKCLTISMNDKPWGQQTYDAYESMIRWLKLRDGSWSYDFSIFDTYVEAADEVGAATQINCYSMVPWGNKFYYTEEETGDVVEVHAPPGSEAYNELLSPFLVCFREHLKAKDWLERTCIAMDERKLEDLQVVIDLVQTHAPGLKLALAANKNLTEIIDQVHDYCFKIAFEPDRALNEKRTRAGQKTTFYVCCVPPRPNTFTYSPPTESTWLGWYAAAHHYDGFLRWAIDHWNRDPFECTDYGNWPTGDCYLIYPGPRTSIRFERLREGIQDYEKIRMLRATLQDPAALERLEEALAGFVYPQIGSDEELAERLNQSKQILLELSMYGVRTKPPLFPRPGE